MASRIVQAASKSPTSAFPLLRRALVGKSVATLHTQSTPLPTAVQEYSKSSPGLSKVTTLPNGIRVASENIPWHFTAAGVYVDAGSRYETSTTRGVSHILDRLAFKSTANKSADEILAEVESLGGNVMCSSSRESIMYQSAVFSQDIERVVSLFSDVVCRPNIDPIEVMEQQQTALYEIEEIWSKPEMILPEILHTVAYANNTLGNPLLCPPESLETMTSDLIQNYKKTWYRPERMVLAACGIEHERIVDLAMKHFGHLPVSETSMDSVETHKTALIRQQSGENKPSLMKSLFGAKASDAYSIATQPAYYTGGTQLIDVPDAPFTHVYIAFEGVSIDDNDLYALATLQILLGGGGSFSAGGPGKGMYSRLFSNVLNQSHWVESCQAFNHCYTDSGLFGIAGSCQPEYANALVDVICREFDTIARIDSANKNIVTQGQLDRAKNQLKSSLLINLESRMVQLEDLGRQIQVHGKKTSIDEMLYRVEQVDLHELHRVASRVVRGEVSKTSGGSGKPTLVIRGNLRSVKDVSRVIANYGLGH
ncbi:peptidase M16 inactive domain-containing protein [Spinellus fusiger]|nr:peptidase M16 inactive domain-containing protein [Spinellus fusiger]